jgi:hypothetical protein
MSAAERVADPVRTDPASAAGVEAERDLGGVGQVVPAGRRVPPALLARLDALLRDGVPAEVSAGLRDPRLTPEVWTRVLAREIATTAGWAASRSLALAGRLPVGVPCWTGAGRVLTLLPAHGLAVHTIRRALPFALCGVPVSVVGHARQASAVAATVRDVRRLLDLPDALFAAPSEPAQALVRQAAAGDLVVLTGRQDSAVAVRAATRATVLGATGGCVLLIGPRGAESARAARLLRAEQHPDSCTRFGGAWHGASAAPHTAGPLWRNARGTCRRPGDLLATEHPSAVYRLCGSLERPAASLHGYAVLPCDGHARVGALVGFGRDPRHGWPGDFLV